VSDITNKPIFMSTKIDISTVRDKVRTYILQASSAERNKIKDDSKIFKEGYFDSMGFVMLITYLEETFDIKTIDADLIEENFESINSISDFVVRKAQ
jgi:acyl carrier protein